MLPPHRPGQPPGPTTPTMAAPPEPALATRDQQRRLSSSALFGNQLEIEIEHGPAVYRLRRTALGKLILTK